MGVATLKKPNCGRFGAKKKTRDDENSRGRAARKNSGKKMWNALEHGLETLEVHERKVSPEAVRASTEAFF